MISSLRITPKWLASCTVLESRFQVAEALFDNEDYNKAKEVIDGLLVAEIENDVNGCISNLQVLVMYGWVLFKMKDLKETIASKKK